MIDQAESKALNAAQSAENSMSEETTPKKQAAATKRAKAAATAPVKKAAARKTAPAKPAGKAVAKAVKKAPVAGKSATPKLATKAKAAVTSEGSDTAGLVKGLADDAASNTLAVNPLMGLRFEDLGEGVKAFFDSAVKQPMKAVQHWSTYALELSKVLTGDATEPYPKDKRFTDPAWRNSAVLKRLLQAHAATGSVINNYLDSVNLDPRAKARAQLVASIYIDAIAPSNTLINPAALKKAKETRGQSLVKGMKNLVGDMRNNGGLPSSVDKSKFELGKNLCLTPGQVVFKSDVLELIQYKPQTAEVFQRPLVICPPQVNKFYAMDLSPEKSLVKFVVEQGVQVFCVSWFNPGEKQRDWNMSSYVKALDEAVDVAREITGSPDITLWGACSGGMTAASYVGWLAATGQDKVHNVVSPVCTLDPENVSDTSMGLFITPESIAAIKASTKARGYVDGEALARVFAWLRPNDLIWNYWVNNYLLGNDPPAFDILYWNADTTRLPAGFHADLLDIMQDSPFINAGKFKVLGESIDMKKVKVDAYIVAGITDHITPWKSCYPTARIYGDKSTFTLVNAGHLQSLLNPPGAAKSFFLTGQVGGPDPEAWSAGASRIDGSWWPHWMSWMHARSGDKVPAPAKLGSAKNKPGVAAPGEYVMQK
ncbi:alpha/beta fold hydrolase [Variovorax rhizosphaerae]|uniref:Alpha/beta fold hydrolase n=1 Tax=Variovorax rhizosphaerae TaxID=1836200 RepID=A0ABU8WCZ8_9BURK